MTSLAVALDRKRARATGEQSKMTAGEVLVEALLREQQTLTAVDSFSEWHDTRGTDDASDGVAGSHQYRQVVPAAPPGPGQQYAFDVSLDDCTGCKACVSGCHSLNGLDADETWRSAGLLLGGSSTKPVQVTVSTSCHHCLEPACAHGCPVGAYEKDPLTGIVHHLDDQCIGCQYCLFTCPFGAPRFSPARGIVRKCDMCSGRLSAGEAPACVQACPNDAIAIRIVDVHQVVEECETGELLPGAPPPRHTFSTTSYRTERVLPRNLMPADYHAVLPQHAHPALVVFLVLSQMSVGLFAASVFGQAHSAIRVVALAIGVASIAASTLHLGRPLYAFRAVLGVRTSWLSREVVAFGAFVAAAAAFAVAGAGVLRLPTAPWLEAVVVGAGIAGVACSVMVYAVTDRALWRAGTTALRFACTGAVLGCALLAAITIRQVADADALLYVVMAATGIKLATEGGVFLHMRDRSRSPLRRSALLLAGPLARLAAARMVLALAGGLCGPALLIWGRPESVAFAVAAASCAAVLAGELIARHLFFAAVTFPRMPGAPS